MKFLLIAIVFALSAISTPSSAANEWKEFWVNEAHDVNDGTLRFSARVSFTVESMPPTIGREFGADYAGLLYLEVFTLARLSQCPQASISTKFDSGVEIIYEAKLKYNASEAKCWAEVSEPKTPGRINPGGYATTYFQMPIYLRVSHQNVIGHALYVKDGNRYRVFNFNLNHSL